MAKRKRKRSSKGRFASKRVTAGNPKRKRAKRRHVRKHAANPKRVHRRRRAKRRMSANPRRRRAHVRVHAKRRHHRRARHANPHHARRRGKRRHRRNPGLPTWAMAGLAGAAGLGAFALSTSAAFGLTKRFDPALATLERNRYIAGGLFTALGLGLAMKWPLIGAGVAAGGLAALAGTQLSFAIDPVFQLGAAPAAAAPAAAPAATTKGLGAIFNGRRQMLGMGAVFAGNRQRLGAVFNGQAQILSGMHAASSSLDDDDYGYAG